MRGKKWIYLERDLHFIDRMKSISKGKNDLGRNTLHRQEYGPSQKVRAVPQNDVVSFYRLGNFTDS